MSKFKIAYENEAAQSALKKQRLDDAIVPSANSSSAAAPRLPAQISAQSSSSVAGGSSSSTNQPDNFRKTIGRLFLDNHLSGLQAHTLLEAAKADGCAGIDDLAKAGARGKLPGNLHRDLLRGLLRATIWPHVYYAAIPVKDPATSAVYTVPFPFLLPHEMMFELKNHVRLQEFTAAGNPAMEKLVADFSKTFRLAAEDLIPIGLHGDGAPFATKMRDSLEQLSWNFLAGSKNKRFVFTAIPKSCCSANTMDEILAVFAWSMRVLAQGKMPAARHDGVPFGSDPNCVDHKSRLGNAGASLTAHACLVQIRGDWAFYKSTFNFPSWASHSICWLCKAQKKRGSQFDFRSCGKDAAWRQARFQPGEFEALLRALGKQSSIFLCPGLRIRHFMVDWLHAVDIGIAQSILGNLFWEVSQLLPGCLTNQNVVTNNQ